MFFSKPWFRWLWLLGLIVAVFLAVKLFKVESSLLKLLPQYETAQTNALISKASERVNKQLVLMASAEDRLNLVESFKIQLHEFEAEEFISSINYQVDLAQIQSVYQALLPYRHNLFSADDQQALAQGFGADYFVQQAQESLYGVQQLSFQQLQADPLFIWQRLIESMARLNALTFDTSDAYFMVNELDQHHMVAFVELAESAFLPENQTAVADGINVMRSALSSQNVNLSAFGAVLYAHQAFQDAKHEISTVGLGSLLGIIFLVALVFRSFMPLLLSLSCIALGLVVSLVVTLLVFGQVHAFALVFGATIAGVSIDYCFHYLVEAAFTRDQQGGRATHLTVQKILPGLLMGFCSSALVYSGFLITGYAVLAQIALFSVFGLLAVLINVLVVFPWLHQSKGFSHVQWLLKLSNFMLRNPIQKYLKQPLLPLGLLFVAGFFSYQFIQPDDDVRALQQLSSELKQQETHIRNTLSWPSSEYYVLITADSIDTMLQYEAEVLQSLREQQHDVVGVADFIPSVSQQQLQHQQQVQLYADAAVRAYFQQSGLPVAVLPEFSPLDVAVLHQAAFELLFKQRWLGAVNQQQALIIPLQNQVELPEHLIAEQHVILIQQAADTSALFAQFRVKSTWMLGVAVLLLWLLLGVFRYGLLAAAHLVAVPLNAGFVALLLASFVGLHISLFSILALLLVLGMGLDYVVFLRENHQPQHVMLALIMSSLTTILAFGLLAFSQVAVLQSFGFMVSIGIAVVLVTAPAVVVNPKSKKINKTEESYEQ